MPLREWLFTNMTIRNMLADFGVRNDKGASKKFTEYFEYKIGRYKSGDFLLYFPELPFWEQYRNEAFNKLKELNGSSIKKYFQFHFDRFEDKPEFLAFVKYELTVRLSETRKNEMKIKLAVAQEWVAEKEKELLPPINDTEVHRIMEQIESLINDQKKNSQAEITDRFEELKHLILKKTDHDLEDKERLKDVLNTLPSANIELSNAEHEERLIQFLYLLSTVKYSQKKSDESILFKSFVKADIASILKLHFVYWKEKKFGTIQKAVGEAIQKIKVGDPKAAKLSEAMTEYFYR